MTVFAGIGVGVGVGVGVGDDIEVVKTIGVWLDAGFGAEDFLVGVGVGDTIGDGMDVTVSPKTCAGDADGN